jgi:iron complex transport system ATP-binding protein
MYIEVKDLSCGYHGKTVISNINMTIKNGELWCVLGVNGIGKTTFFKTLLGLLKPETGSVSFDGVNISQMKRSELAKNIAYVPQNHIPPFPFLVEEIILMGRNPHRRFDRVNKADRTACNNAMRILGIEYLRQSVYTRISGGERQLVLLARAIAQETSCMILDEPVSNLDFGNQARVISHVCALVKDMKKTILMTSHFPDHGFLPDCNVILLHKDNVHFIGKGFEIITEQSIRDLYKIDNCIVTIEEYQKKICIPLYEKR